MGYQRQNDLKLEGMKETVSNLTQRVNLIESGVAVSKVEKRANLSFTTVSLFRSPVTFRAAACRLAHRWHSTAVFWLI